MQVIKYPPSARWPELQRRAASEQARDIADKVELIYDEVRQFGDQALRRFTHEFDGVDLTSLLVSEAELAAAAEMVPASLRAAIGQARANIEAFHGAQREPVQPIETMPGVTCWRQSVPVQRVGLYIPGGRAPLFSTLLMLGVPARLAGCPVVVLATPPQPDGSISPLILYTAQQLGITTIVKAGGAQAIAALAGGTESVPTVDKLFGPGNRYVTAAKQLAVQRGVAIDLPAGPSEVLVIADETANPVFVAADLLSQAEHGPDSQGILLTTSAALLEQVQVEVERQLARLPRQAIAAQALRESRAVLLHSVAEILDFSNQYAPEHLVLAVDNVEAYVAGITNAGSVFLGHYTPEAAGDYASGTNHTLPTGGYARSYSGVSLDSFYKKITFQRLTPAGLQHVGPVVEALAEAEGMYGHARAVSLRLAALQAETAAAAPTPHL